MLPGRHEEISTFPSSIIEGHKCYEAYVALLAAMVPCYMLLQVPPKRNVDLKLKTHCFGLKNNNCSKIVHRDHHRDLIKSLGFGSILLGQDRILS